MKTKILTSVFLFFMSVFLFAHHAAAASPGTVTVDPTVLTLTVGNVGILGSSGGFDGGLSSILDGSTLNLLSLQVNFAPNPAASTWSGTPSCISVEVFDTATLYNSNNCYNLTTMGAGGIFTFEFTIPSTAGGTWGHVYINGDFSGTEQFQDTTLNVSSSVILSSYFINWDSNFYNGLNIPGDFRSWQFKISAPANVPYLGWGVNYYNASSTNLIYEDSYNLPNFSGNASALTNTVFPLVKKTNLPPGTYFATGYLDNFSSSTSAATILATTSQISFTIGTGTPILSPGTSGQPNGGLPPNYSPTGSCTPTSFSIGGADIGQGICDIFAFLFVPSQDTLTQFGSLQNVMSTHAPFSYFYQATAALQNITVSSSSISGLTISTGTNTPIHVTADMFSSDTINRYTTTSSRSAVRTLLQVVLYLLFLTMVIVEVRNLFKGGGGNQK